VEEYVNGKKHLWIDTADLKPDAKRDVLTRHLPY
jgi:hypothetical protein